MSSNCVLFSWRTWTMNWNLPETRAARPRSDNANSISSKRSSELAWAMLWLKEMLLNKECVTKKARFCHWATKSANYRNVSRSSCSFSSFHFRLERSRTQQELLAKRIGWACKSSKYRAMFNAYFSCRARMMLEEAFMNWNMQTVNWISKTVTCELKSKNLKMDFNWQRTTIFACKSLLTQSRPKTNVKSLARTRNMKRSVVTWTRRSLILKTSWRMNAEAR